MSKVDDVFDFADELIDEWGHYVTFVRKENLSTTPRLERPLKPRCASKSSRQQLDISEFGVCTNQRRQDYPRPSSQLHLITEQDYQSLGERSRRAHESNRTRHLRGDRPVAYVIIARPQ